jgi:hypothetical protein
LADEIAGVQDGGSDCASGPSTAPAVGRRSNFSGFLLSGDRRIVVPLEERRIRAVIATAARRAARWGRRRPGACRAGRSSGTASSWASGTVEKSLPLVKYWRGSPLVPRCSRAARAHAGQRRRRGRKRRRDLLLVPYLGALVIGQRAAECSGSVSTLAARRRDVLGPVASANGTSIAKPLARSTRWVRGGVAFADQQVALPVAWHRRSSASGGRWLIMTMSGIPLVRWPAGGRLAQRPAGGAGSGFAHARARRATATYGHR